LGESSNFANSRVELGQVAAPFLKPVQCFGVAQMKLYVGNLSFSTTEETLQAEFGAHGQVDEVAVITDRDTGRPRGFAFVSMQNDAEARAAIEALNGTEIDGRTITVNEARPKSNGGGGGGGRGGPRGGGGGPRGGGGGGKRW
jgi:RNA recognition motif-containing protein